MTLKLKARLLIGVALVAFVAYSFSFHWDEQPWFDLTMIVVWLPMTVNSYLRERPTAAWLIPAGIMFLAVLNNHTHGSKAAIPVSILLVAAVTYLLVVSWKAFRARDQGPRRS